MLLQKHQDLRTFINLDNFLGSSIIMANLLMLFPRPYTLCTVYYKQINHLFGISYAKIPFYASRQQLPVMLYSHLTIQNFRRFQLPTPVHGVSVLYFNINSLMVAKNRFILLLVALQKLNATTVSQIERQLLFSGH